MVMTVVTAQKLRHFGAGRSGAVVGRRYEGVLASQPRVGERLIICRRDGDQMITTAIRRILVDPTGSILYVQTMNSSYRLDLGAPFSSKQQRRAPVRVRLSEDGSEVTVFAEVEEQAPRRASSGVRTRPPGL